CVEFNAGENEDQYQKAVESYKRSLDYYKKALRAYPSCPGAARLGIGYCRYRLGQFDKARQAFHRVLDLDPKNVDALVALGIMELQTNEVDGIQKGMLKMQRAFEIYPYCSVGDFEKAGWYYMASIKEINKPQEFALPFYVCKKAHVQQFVATEDALNKVAEAKSISQKLVKQLHGNGEVLDVWAKERDVAGLKASINTLTSEVQRLNKKHQTSGIFNQQPHKNMRRGQSFQLAILWQMFHLVLRISLRKSYPLSIRS
ncbi:hypothetical protein HPP92_026707, partial [Vanilla planifolia]